MSSIFIKGMELPKPETTKIYKSRIITTPSGEIWIEQIQPLQNGDESSAMFECVNIPTPHGRLIDADALIKDFDVLSSLPEDEQILRVKTILHLIKTEPTIISLMAGAIIGFTLAACLSVAKDSDVEDNPPKEPTKLFTVGCLVKWRGDVYEIKRLYVDSQNQTTAAIRDEGFYFEDVPVEELEAVEE